MDTPQNMPALPFGLGRLYKPDERDHKFLIRSLVGEELSPLVHKHYSTGPILDQGASSKCVAYAGYQWLVSSPVRNKFMDFGEDQLYTYAQQNDEWEGESPAYEGTSVRGLMKAFKNLGYVSSYYWAFNVADCTSFILQHAPMVFGTTWTKTMFSPFKYSRRTFITVGSLAPNNVAGGHAYLAHGVNRGIPCKDGSLGAFLCTNSWGKNWGNRGHFYISFSDIEKLLAQDGEAACAMEVKK